MKTIAMIPARYAATRFPGKLMQTIGDKTIIRHTYENTVATRLFDEVIVVTDSKIIFEEIREKHSDPFLGEYFQWLAEYINDRMQRHPRKPYYETHGINK